MRLFVSFLLVVEYNDSLIPQAGIGVVMSGLIKGKAMPDETRDGERIPTNLRTLLILEVLGKTETAMTPTEINAEIGLPKQTVHRLCSTLESEGFLAREQDGRRFRASRRSRMMGSGLVHASWSNIARHQVLKTVASEVREAVNFVVPEDEGMRYLDRVDADWSFRIQLPVGTHVPFHCTASGKVYMASLTPRARRALVEALILEPRTQATHTRPEPLLDELKVIAKQGYAQDNEEFLEGMVAVAVPITDARGRYVASLAFHGPVQRLSMSEALTRLPILQEGATRLKRSLFTGSE